MRLRIEFCAVVVALLTAANASAQSSDMYASKTAPPSAAVGSNVTYTITIGNNGPDDAPNATLTDTLPSGGTFVSISSPGSFSCTTPIVGDAGGTVTCSTATLTAGSSATFTVTQNVSAGAAGTTLINSAAATSDNPDDNSENNTSISGTDIPGGNLADVSIVKTGPSAAPANTDVTYTITVTNLGPNDATNVTWTDTLPDSVPSGSAMTFVSFNQTSGPAFNCGVPGTTTTCTIASFPNGSTASFQLTGHIPNGTASGATYSNQAAVTSDNDPSPENDVSGIATTVSSVDVGVAKSAPATAIAGGAAFDYVITLSNGGPDAAQNAGFTDTLPAGINFVSLTQNSGPSSTCSQPLANTNGTVLCDVGLLGNGGSAQFTITVQAQPTVANGTLVTNTATASTTSADTNANNNTSTASTTISTQSDLSIVKSGPASVTAGTNATYTIAVANSGPSDATNISWVDALPPGTTFVSLQQNTGTTFNCTTGATITCTAATFASGASATFTLVVSVAGSATGSLSNTANITSSTTDTNPGNNSSTLASTVVTSADLSVTKSGPATVNAGANLTWTINVANAGPSDAASVSLVDVLPAGTTFVSMTQTTGPTFNCTGTATVTCSAATFANGATASFTLVASTASSATGSVSNTATITSTTSDPSAANNSSTAQTTLSSSADLAVTKSGSPSSIAAGDNITWTIVVTNGGPSDASNVTVTDVLPANTTFVSLNQSGVPFTCTTPAAGANGTVSCTAATFANGASTTFTLIATTDVTTPASTLTNTATVSSATTDPVASNNTSTSSTTVGTVDLSLMKSVSSGPYIAGTPVTFTLTVTNNGTFPATNVVVTDPLPGGMSATSTTPSGACTGTTTVTCTAATLAPGGTLTFTITGNLPALAANYTNTATVSSANGEAVTSNNTGSAGFAVIPAAPIPTLSPLLLALMAAFIGMAAVVALRR